MGDWREGLHDWLAGWLAGWLAKRHFTHLLTTHSPTHSLVHSLLTNQPTNQATHLDACRLRHVVDDDREKKLEHENAVLVAKEEHDARHPRSVLVLFRDREDYPHVAHDADRRQRLEHRLPRADVLGPERKGKGREKKKREGKKRKRNETKEVRLSE